MVRMFKLRGKKGASAKGGLNDYDRSSPTGVAAPIDPDGSTASHSSHENNARRSQQPPPEQRDPMTASQFDQHSDEEMAKKGPLNIMRSNIIAARKQGKDSNVKSREGVPIITSAGADHFSPSAVSSSKNYATEGFYSKSKRTFGGKDRPKVRPSAKMSAFGGAPRYDWMDIETTAAIKIQANYRRIQTQNYLDAEGLSTPGMRNRRAQRQARQQARMSRATVSQDVPFPFNLCGVGLLFGDATMEDETIVDGLQKKKSQKAKEQYEREDAEKRKFRMKKKESQSIQEGIEVVESFEGKEEEGDEAEDATVGESTAASRRSFGKMSPRRMMANKSKRLSRNQNAFDPSDDESL